MSERGSITGTNTLIASDDEANTVHRRWVKQTMACAAHTGQLEVVRYLYDNELLEPSCQLLFSAALHGHMNIAKWSLAKFGSLELVQ